MTLNVNEDRISLTSLISTEEDIKNKKKKEKRNDILKSNIKDEGYFKICSELIAHCHLGNIDKALLTKKLKEILNEIKK